MADPSRTLVLVLAAALALPLVAAFPPETVPEECYVEEAFPGADVLFLLDLTGSMGGVLSTAKAEASLIMQDLAAEVGDVRFGASSHMDYPAFYSYPGYATQYGSPGDYPWRLDADMTTDVPAVQAAIDALALGNGADGPESYVTAMYESGESVSWGAGRIKVVVFFADNVPHDLSWNGRNTGGEPGRDAIAMTADDLDWETTVAGLATRGIRVVGIDSGGAGEMMSYLADETGGNWTRLGSGASFRQTVVEMVLGVVGGPTPHDEAPPTLSIVSPASPRLLVDGVDVGASPFPETALVGSDLPVMLAAADDCKLMRVEVRLDGQLVRTFTDHPLGYLFPGATAAPGLHLLEFRAIDWQGHAATAALPVRVLRVSEAATAQGLYAGVNVPASAEVFAGMAQASGDAAADDTAYGARSVATLAGEVSYETLRGTATSDVDGAVATATAVSTIGRLELLDGRIQATTIRAVSSVSSTIGGAYSTDTTGSWIAGLVVDGTPIEVTSPGQEVALPGLGYVRLFDVEAVADAARAQQQVTMIHVFLDAPSLKGEIMVASAFAAAGALDGPVGLHRDINDVDDAGTDADAAASLANATPLSPGVVAGRLGPDDPIDAYRFPAAEGDRIVLGLSPAPVARVSLLREPVPGDLGVGTAAEPDLDAYLSLYDPDGVLRDVTVVGAADRIEMNADKAGDWKALVRQGSVSSASERNYTLAFHVSPVVFLDGDDLDGDAPASCAAARPVAHGPHAGVMRGADVQDAYEFDVSIGEVVTVALKPDELDDGANFDLLLYDPDCVLLTTSEFGDRHEILPKGSPDAVLQLPAERTGSYRVVVVRENGVGNYHLEIASEEPMPTAPLNDAGTGRDSTGPGDAIPIGPTSVQQGRFPDEHDDVDWYVVSATPGQRLRVVLEASAASSFRLVAYGPGMTFVAASGSELGVPATVDLASGSYHLAVERVSGGGNYVLAAATTAR